MRTRIAIAAAMLTVAGVTGVAGTVATAEPAAAMDGLCDYMYRKQHSLFMLMNIPGLDGLRAEFWDVSYAIYSAC